MEIDKYVEHECETNVGIGRKRFTRKKLAIEFINELLAFRIYIFRRPLFSKLRLRVVDPRSKHPCPAIQSQARSILFFPVVAERIERRCQT